VEKRRKMERKRKEQETRPPEPSMKVRPLELRKEALDTRQRWRKEEKWREREKKKRPAPPEPSMKVRPLELRKEALDTRQRLKTKVEPAVKFNPLGFYPGSATEHGKTTEGKKVHSCDKYMEQSYYKREKIHIMS
jgi:hypothetical protein